MIEVRRDAVRNIHVERVSHVAWGNALGIAVILGKWHNQPMKKADVDALVLAKVNVPHSKVLDADAITFFLTHPMEMGTAIGPMSTFFYELDGDLQRRFAEFHDVPLSSLETASTMFDQWSGARRIVASGA